MERQCNSSFVRTVTMVVTELRTKDLRIADALNVGIAKMEEGDYTDAHAYYEQIRPLFENAEPLERAKYHNGLGVLYRKQGEAEKAIQEYGEVKAYLELTDDPQAVAMVENNLANVLLDIGRVSEAHQRLDEAEVIFTAHSESTYLAQTFEIRARCYYQQSDYQAAAIAINRSEALLLHGFMKDPLVETLKTKAIIGQALEAWVCLEYRNPTLAAQRFGITAHGVRKKIRKYFASS